MLTLFGKITGQMVNLQKSSVYFSPRIHPKHGKIIAKILKVPLMTKNDRYLGTPLFFDKNRKANFEPLLKKYYSTLEGWKSKLLSQAGRTVLIKSILQAYPTYQMQVLALPKETLDQLDHIQRNFWWKKEEKKKQGGFIRAWKIICKPIHQGGLGIKNPHQFNVALLTKLASRLIAEHDQLWVKLLKAKYYPNSHPLEASKKSNLSWIWTSIKKGLNLGVSTGPGPPGYH